MAEFIILLHAILGTAALLSGAVAILSKKGNKIHVLAGKIFYFAMLIGVSFSIIVCFLPEHTNYFLLAIGIFSLYLIIGGKRSLRFKNTSHNYTIDKVVATIMLLAGLSMLLLPPLVLGQVNIVLSVFGLTGVLFALRDFKQFKYPESVKSKYLKLHLGKMMGGYIAAFTAFLVVNQVIDSIWVWFLPTIPGSAYISYWMIKLK